MQRIEDELTHVVVVIVGTTFLRPLLSLLF